MVDLEAMKKMLGLTESFISVREEKMLWEEIEYMAAKLSKTEYNTTLSVPTPVLRSILRALVVAEAGWAEARNHLQDREEESNDLFS